MKRSWTDIARPIRALSPMADMTDSAFCRTVKLVDPDGPVVFREMISAEAVVRGNDKTLEMASIHPDERPLVQQIFGSDPDTMAKAARIIERKYAPEGIDINMGCPVFKLVHSFNGAALMKEPERACEIVRRVKAVVSVPVSVKIRTGWDDPHDCLDFSKRLEEAGADLLAVHGRTKKQGYSGQADWDMIGKVKQGVSIPVLANGDIHTAALTFKALEQTECDGVLIARGALGNPWIFSQIHEILHGKEPTTITIDERIRIIKQHLTFHIQQYGPRAVVTFRKHLTWYFRGIPDMKPFKLRMHTADTENTLNVVLDEILHAGLPGISDRDTTHPEARERKPMSK